MPLLPVVECKYPPKPNVPSGLLPTVGPLLSLDGGDIFPVEAPFPGHPHVRAHQVLTSWPTCTRPFNRTPSPDPGLLPSGLFSPVVATDLKHGACAALPAHVAAVFCSCRDPPSEPAAGDLNPFPRTLQLFPTSEAAVHAEPLPSLL